MKIVIVDDGSNVIGTVDDLQDYDLDKPLARASIIEDIKDIIEQQE